MPTSLRRLARLYLEGLHGFDAVEEGALEQLLGQGSVVQTDRGKLLSSRAAASTHVHLLLQGVATLGWYDKEDEERERVMGFLAPGELWGLQAVFLGRRALNSVRAHEDCASFAVPVGKVVAVLQASHPLTMALATQLAFKARVVSHLLEEARDETAHTRLLRTLARLAMNFGVNESDGSTRIGLRLPQATLARLLNLSRQQTNVALQALERSGSIFVARETIFLKDRSMLAGADWTGSTFTLTRLGARQHAAELELSARQDGAD